METFWEVLSIAATLIAIVALFAIVGGLFFWIAITANGANPFR